MFAYGAPAVGFFVSWAGSASRDDGEKIAKNKN